MTGHLLGAAGGIEAVAAIQVRKLVQIFSIRVICLLSYYFITGKLLF